VTARRAHHARQRGQKEHIEPMLSRSLHTSTVGRAANMRRLRRRITGSGRLFCATNGCASFLEVDVDRHEAVCPICGYRRQLN
jgi:hypothetical protein